MPILTPTARLGIILSSGNRTLEPYFRSLAPDSLGLHITRMRMGSAGKRSQEDIAADAIQCAALLADAGVDAIDLQGTGIMMERGPGGEAKLVQKIEAATDTATYTATQAVVEALKSLSIARVAIVNPGNAGAIERETKYFDQVGIAVAGSVGLDCGEGTFDITPEQWVDAAIALDRDNVDGFFLSGSHTRMVEAIAPLEQAIGKPVVTSIQAALWAGVRRLKVKLGTLPPCPELGKLFETL
ncbi:MAG: maleate isomerase [Alphaproteobacteria bacterium]|jgi:maleate isomerase